MTWEERGEALKPDGRRRNIGKERGEGGEWIQIMEFCFQTSKFNYCHFPTVPPPPQKEEEEEEEKTLFFSLGTAIDFLYYSRFPSSPIWVEEKLPFGRRRRRNQRSTLEWCARRYYFQASTSSSSSSSSSSSMIEKSPDSTFQNC